MALPNISSAQRRRSEKNPGGRKQHAFRKIWKRILKDPTVQGYKRYALENISGSHCPFPGCPDPFVPGTELSALFTHGKNCPVFPQALKGICPSNTIHPRSHYWSPCIASIS